MGLFSSLLKPKNQKKPLSTRAVTIQNLLPKAQQGDLPSILALAKEYAYGVTDMGITLQESREEAARWYQKAAERGNGDAMLNLGQLYDPSYGLIIRKDPALALSWYERACDAGQMKACARVGRLALASRDYAKARKYFAMGAQENDAQALVSLGRLYALGQGVTQDFQKALIFYRRAAAYGSSFAELHLGDMYYSGTGVDADMEEAASHYMVAKQKNVPAAEAMVDYMMLRGEIPLTKPENDVFQHLLRLSDGFSRDRGGYLIATFFEEGYGLDQDYGKAVKYYELSAKAGFLPAMKKLRVLEGMSWPGHEANQEKADYWSTKIREAEE